MKAERGEGKRRGNASPWDSSFFISNEGPGKSVKLSGTVRISAPRCRFTHLQPGSRPGGQVVYVRVSLPRVPREARPIRRGQFLRDPAPRGTDLATRTCGARGQQKEEAEEEAAEGTRTTQGTHPTTSSRGRSQCLLANIKHKRPRGRPVWPVLLDGFYLPHRPNVERREQVQQSTADLMSSHGPPCQARVGGKSDYSLGEQQGALLTLHLSLSRRRRSQIPLNGTAFRSPPSLASFSPHPRSVPAPYHATSNTMHLAETPSTSPTPGWHHGPTRCSPRWP